MLFFVSFQRESGKIAVSQIDFNESLGGGASYLVKNPTYKQAGITGADWLQHNVTYYKSSGSGTSTLPMGVSNYRPKKPPLLLEVNKYGEPLLSDPAKGPQDQIYLQRAVRTFLALHYGKALAVEFGILNGATCRHSV